MTIPKPWGNELIWARTDDYVGKVLTIEAGKRLSLQYHERKTETILVATGRLLLHFGPSVDEVETKVLGPGDHFHVPPGMVHRFEAITDTRLVEVSTPELDDVVRLVDDYGREGTSQA
jgi:mannose-6-phosphate isomerase-like protein (cupin superfamily)